MDACFIRDHTYALWLRALGNSLSVHLAWMSIFEHYSKTRLLVDVVSLISNNIYINKGGDYDHLIEADDDDLDLSHLSTSMPS